MTILFYNAFDVIKFVGGGGGIENRKITKSADTVLRCNFRSKTYYHIIFKESKHPLVDCFGHGGWSRGRRHFVIVSIELLTP